MEAREQLRGDDAARQRARLAAEARRADAADAAARAARGTAADYFKRLAAALERAWALQAEVKHLRSAVVLPAGAEGAGPSTTAAAAAAAAAGNVRACAGV